MGTWLKTVVSNPRLQTTVMRFGIGYVGYLIHSGTLVIPDFVYQYLSDPGTIAMLSALLIPSSARTPQTPVDAPVTAATVVKPVAPPSA